jgi:adenylylsulfate kinase
MSWAIWITGRPGSGKSAVAREAAARLRREGLDVVHLELDELRETWTPTPTYSDAEREMVYGGLAHVAASLVAAGTPVLIDATAHRRAWRDRARAIISHFAEVQLECSLEVSRVRESARRESHAPRDIYARAGRPGARVPGVDVPYEAARAPELALNTEALDVATTAGHVVALARGLADASLPPRAVAERGCVLWITGRPGSGKSTLARGVADGLRAAGAEPILVELAPMRRVVLGDRFASEGEEETVHLMLATLVQILAARGVVVIVDATTPRRAWRDVARRSVPVFAEVQLVCPPELCAARERDARWHLHGAAGWPAPPAAPSGGRAPEICLDYEESSAAELTLHTHVQGHWSAVRQTLSLAWRLLGSGPPEHVPAHPSGRPDETGRRPTCSSAT